MISAKLKRTKRFKKQVPDTKRVLKMKIQLFKVKSIIVHTIAY